MNRAQRRAAARAQRQPGKPAALRRGPRLVSDPVQHAIAGVMPLTAEQRDDLAMRGHTALAAIAHGHGSQQSGAHLAAMAEITLALVECVAAQAGKRGDTVQIGVAAEALGIAQRACNAARSLSDRAARHDRWGFTGPELQALKECMELHEQFLELAPQWLVESAVSTARARATALRVEAARRMRAAA